jgi:hypothetical protein
MVTRGIGGKDIWVKEKERLLRDIVGIKDFVRLQWRDLTTLELTRDDYVTMREGIDGLLMELIGLLDRLKASEG